MGAIAFPVSSALLSVVMASAGAAIRSTTRLVRHCVKPSSLGINHASRAAPLPVFQSKELVLAGAIAQDEPAHFNFKEFAGAFRKWDGMWQMQVDPQDTMVFDIIKETVSGKIPAMSSK